MSHGGPMTAVQKKLEAMRVAAARSAQRSTGPHAPLLPPVYDNSSSASTSPRAPANERPLISYGDIEMEDAVPSPPPVNYSHVHAQPAFSPAARPFIPPSAMAPVNMAPLQTSVRKPPPHHALQNQQPAITSTAAASDSASPAPVIKTEPPASPAVSVRSTVPPHQRIGPHANLGPHVKSGPHAQKPPVAPHMQPSTQYSAPSTVQHQPSMSSQEVLVNFESPKSADKTPAVADPWAELERPKVKTEPGTSGTEHSSVYAQANSESQISEATTIIAPTPTTNGTASVSDKNALSKSVDLNGSKKMSNSIPRFARNEWLVLLFSMDDTDKGRQLIRAFTDHIRAGLDAAEIESSSSNTPRELILETPGGQRIPVTVPQNTSISDIVNDFADFTHTRESEISVVLKVRVDGHII